MLWLIVLIIILGGAVYIKSLKAQLAANGIRPASPTQSITQTATGITTTTQAQTCGLIVKTPVRGATVRFPLTVSGTIDNTKPDQCTWGMFEGTAGTVQLYVSKNGQWQPVGSQTPVPVASWTSNMTTFAVTINPGAAANSITQGTALKLTFMAENPSGDPAREVSIDYPLAY